MTLRSFSMKTKIDPAWDAALRAAYERIAWDHEVSADTIAETDAYRDLLFEAVTCLNPTVNWSKDEMSHRLTILRRRKGGLRSLKDILATKRAQGVGSN
jgi:hypothetical protein